MVIGQIDMYQLIVLLSLIVMVILVAIGKPERHWIGLMLIVILISSGAVSLNEALAYINWDVLGLILGMSILSALLERSGLIEVLSHMLLSSVSSPERLLFLLVLLSGIVSIALENVTVVLLFAPIAFKLAEKIGANPAPMIIGLALSSNMAGSATMIGDPPAIITAGHYNLSFMDFIWYQGKPSMFFITLIPMIISTYVYTIISRKSFVPKNWVVKKNYNIRFNKEMLATLTKDLDKMFLFEAFLFLTIKIVLLSIRDLIHIPLTLAAIIGTGGLILVRLCIHRDIESVKTSIKEGFEWKLIVFLAGVFVLSGAFAKHGLAIIAADYIVKYSGKNLFIVTAILIWLSVAVSAVMDNTPYVVTMIPVIDRLATDLAVNPLVLAWALLLGATLGGGITYIGASANLVAVRLLEKKGYRITFADFIRKSLPFNLTNIFTGWILFIIFWLLR